MEDMRLNEVVRTRLENFQSLNKTKPYIGTEFLTWLWFASESGWLVGKVEFDLWIDDRLGLKPYNLDGHETTFKGGEPAGSRAAQASLLSGHMVREMRVGISAPEYEVISAVLNSRDLAPSSLIVRYREMQTTSEDLESSSVEEDLIRKLDAVEYFCDALDHIYSLFFDLRLAADWHRVTIPEFRAWVLRRDQPKSAAELH